MKIKTKRLTIRNFREDDNVDLFEYLSDPVIYKFEPGKPIAMEIATKLAMERSRNNDFLALELYNKNKMIGHIYFKQIESKELLTWELGYIVNPFYQNKGYATEGAQAVINYGFKEMDAHRIIAHCSPENIASWKLLEKIGMRREGTFRKNIFFYKTDSGEPIWQDTYEYAILSDDALN